MTGILQKGGKKESCLAAVSLCLCPAKYWLLYLIDFWKGQQQNKDQPDKPLFHLSSNVSTLSWLSHEKVPEPNLVLCPCAYRGRGCETLRGSATCWGRWVQKDDIYHTPRVVTVLLFLIRITKKTSTWIGNLTICRWHITFTSKLLFVSIWNRFDIYWHL